ncbi:MAG: CorA family divalent cation transporter, partial [Gammaproteobacteria bacterium]
MRRFMCIDSDGVTLGDEALIEDWHSNPDAWLWIDLEGEPPEAEKALLVDRLGLEPTDLEDAQRPRHPPQFHPRGTGFFLLLKALRAESHDMDFTTQQVAVFLADRLLVTRRDYAQAGGFPDQPLMEDVALVRAL